MATCPNGHPNPAGQHFCGECGVVLTKPKPPATTKAHRLVVGDRVQVVAPGDEHHGKTGTVDQISEGDVWVRFSSLGLHTYGYRPSQLKGVHHAPPSSESSVIAAQAEPRQQPPPPGWYPDPSGKPGRMYWDGYAWHNAIPAKPGPERPPIPPTSPKDRKALWIIVGVVVGILVLVGIVGNMTSTGPDSSDSTNRSKSAESASDKAFIAKLDTLNVPYKSRHDAIIKGQAVCLFLDVNPNAEFADAVNQLREQEFSDLSGFDAEMKALSFAAAATDVYCPEHKPTGAK